MAERVCIVSGKLFDDEREGYKWSHDGTWYYIRDIGDRNKFIADPKKYIEAAAAPAQD